MKGRMNFYLGVICALIFCIFGCEGAGTVSVKENQKEKSEIITIANWNTQEFFDSQKDGCEYKEFLKSEKWDEDAYKTRLSRLCEVLRELNADIFVFEEIENEAVLYDISNQLAGDSWKQSELWSYSCFAKTSGTAIGVAILSRYPLVDVKYHNLDIRTQSAAQPSMRPILEAQAEIKNKKITIFANHWKSKSGGAEKSDIWRDWSESQLAGLLLKRQKSDAGFVAVMCGDFNRDIKEFVLNKNMADENGNVIFRNAGFGECNILKAKNPWLDENGSFATEKGSYVFNKNWERIDHIFVFGNAEILKFEPKTGEGWSDENGKPIGYKIYNGNGYSDHLPVMATVKIQ